MIGIPLDDLKSAQVPEFDICEEIFAHNLYYSADKIFRDVPGFRPEISLEMGMASVIEHMDQEGRIPDSEFYLLGKII